MRLNPFEFRAGLEPSSPTTLPKPRRLNPFEFRAGLERADSLAQRVLLVLIPLNSGLAWSKWNLRV